MEGSDRRSAPQTSQLLDRLLALFAGEIPEAEFLRAWRSGNGNRRLSRVTVTGEVDGETWKPGSQELRCRFRIFLPEGEGAEKAEELFAAMCIAAGREYPGFSAISRGSMDRDRVSGLLSVSCTLSFVSAAAGGHALIGSVELGGRTYSVTGVKTAMARRGQELTAVGETVPFAVLGEETEYTVELEGLNVAGLENLAGFTARIGTEPVTVYERCRWKSISDVLGKAVFVSRTKREEA